MSVFKIRVRCADCGAVREVPVRKDGHLPERCFACACKRSKFGRLNDPSKARKKAT